MTYDRDCMTVVLGITGTIQSFRYTSQKLFFFVFFFSLPAKKKRKQCIKDVTLERWYSHWNVLMGSLSHFLYPLQFTPHRAAIYVSPYTQSVRSHHYQGDPSLFWLVMMLRGCSYSAWGQLTLTSFPRRDAGGQSKFDPAPLLYIMKWAESGK